MDSQKLRAGGKSFFSALTVTLVFSSVFLIRCDPIDNSFSTTITVYLSNFVVLISAALFSYRFQIKLRLLYLVLFVLVVAGVLMPPGATGIVLLLSDIITGSICGIALVMLAGMISFSSPEKIRRIILLGVAGATLVMPLFHFLTNFNGVLIRQILFSLLLVTILGFLLSVKKAGTPIPAAKQALEKYRSKGKTWSGFLFAQRKSNLITLIMIIPFFFCQGVFGNISFEKGFSFSSSDLIMLGTFLVIVILYIADRVKRTNTWFNMICFGVGALYMMIIFSTLVIDDYPPGVYGVMRAGLVIMQIRVLAMLSEIASEQSISPIFLYGVLAFVYLLPNIAGYTMANSLGGSVSDAAILVSGALMAIAIAAGVIVVLLMRSKGFVVEGTIVPPKDKDVSFEQFRQKYSLSAKESEVIQLYTQGRSVRAISAKLYISESTARTYIQRVYSKADIHSRQELLDAIDES